jgi:histidine triad (HIT) family protein
MMACPICDKEYAKNILYENDKISVYMAINPAIPGHLQIFPKQHYAILEEVPNELLSYMSSATNKLSMLLFELLKVHGTNIIIQNGVPAGQTIPHFSINIIPRRTDDNMKLEWDMKQATPESLESIHRLISEGITEVPASNVVAKAIDIFPKTEERRDEMPVDSSEKPADIKSDASDKKINYYLKSLERIP